MTFTFTNYAGIPAQQLRSPFNDMIGQILSGYQGATQARYQPRMLEADIFHKQISPIAMLASSPYFSSLHPEQQKQIAGYVSQMLSRQRMGQPQADMQAGINQGQQGGGEVSGYPQVAAQTGMQGEQQEGETPLSPSGPGEHFTSKFTESNYSAGTPHTNKKGQTIYTPSAEQVARGQQILTETKGLKNLFDDFLKVAPLVAKSGPIKQTVSNIASNVGKVDYPYIKPVTGYISEKLGGSKAVDEVARMDDLKSKMAPSLRSLGFSDKEIQSMFSIYPGENEKNVTERLKSTWPVIERKMNLARENLNAGINVSKKQSNPISQALEAPRQADNYPKAPKGTVKLYKKNDPIPYYIPEKEVNEALESKVFDYGFVND